MTQHDDDPNNLLGLPAEVYTDPDLARLHSQAEQRVKGLEPPEGNALWPTQARQVLHELRVHQIELEMQNEELRATREQLEASKDRYFDLYDLAPVGYFTVSKEGLILEANLTAVTLLGVSRSDLSMQRLSSFVFRDDEDIFYFLRRNLFSTGQPQNCELRLTRNGGAPFWAQLEAAVEPGEGAALSWRVVVHDITDRKRAETSLRESEERFRNMADTASVMIWVCSTDKSFTFFNKTWLDFTGRTMEQELGNGWLEGVHPDDLNGSFARFSRSFDAREDFQFECRLRRADGEYRWVLCRGTPRFESGGVLAGYIGSGTDITEQKYTEGKLRRNLDEIAHLNRVRAMGELTASVAHELNQPLAAILSNAQAATRFLNGESPDLGQVQECLADIVADDKRAGEVIKRLRSLLKKDAFEASDVDLNEVVEDVIRLVRNDALLRGVSVAFEPRPGLPLVQGDRIQLYQVVLNLTLNGLEATSEEPPGNRQVWLRTVESEDGGVLLTVEDSGGGIPAADLAPIFEPFFTTKKEGLGVGLSISRSIMQQHGGRIWAENAVEGGAIFSCLWPATQKAAAAAKPSC